MLVCAEMPSEPRLCPASAVQEACAAPAAAEPDACVPVDIGDYFVCRTRQYFEFSG